MQSCREPPPPHGATPSSPIDCSHSNTHSSVRGCFHTPESVPPPSLPFFTMNPLTDQRLTGSMMPYHPVDHLHATLGGPKVRTFLVLCQFDAPADTFRSRLTIPFSTSTYQDTISWQYATSWDARVLDTGASSGHPSSTSSNPLGMVSPTFYQVSSSSLPCFTALKFNE